MVMWFVAFLNPLSNEYIYDRKEGRYSLSNSVLYGGGEGG